MDLAKEQQQNILRQVAERRAAAASSASKSEVKLERKKPIDVEAKPLPIKEGDSKGDINQPATATTDGIIPPVRKGRFDIDRTDASRKPNSESLPRGVKPKSKPKLNPCRIEGHDHPWSDCPQNPKSDKFVRDNPCRIDGHDHDWNDCPDNPKSDNYVKPTYMKGKSTRGPKSIGNKKDLQDNTSEGAPKEKGNPCRMKGHDHDWNDCTDNPRSANYVKKKGKSSRGPKSLGNKKESPAVSESEEKGPSDQKEEEVEGCKADDTKQEVIAESMKELPEPTEQKVTPAKPKPFVPAPPPVVPAWTKANPLTIGSPSTAATLERSNPEKSGISTSASVSGAGTALAPPSYVQTSLESGQQRQSLETKLEHATSQMTSLLVSPRSDLSFAAATPQDIASKQRALFDGNTALFGKAESSAVYDSWNTPQIGMTNASVGLWRQTPFAPTTAMSPLAGQFGSTWSASAVPIVQQQRMESAKTESKEDVVAPALPMKSVQVDGHGKSSENCGGETSYGEVRSDGQSTVNKKYEYPATNRSSRYQSQRKSFHGAAGRGISNGKEREESTEEPSLDNHVEEEAKAANKALSSRRRQPAKGNLNGRVVDGSTDNVDNAGADEPKPATKRRLPTRHQRSSLSGKGKSKGKVDSRGNDDAAVVSDVVGNPNGTAGNVMPNTDLTSPSPGQGQNEQVASQSTATNNPDATKASTNRSKRPPKKFGSGRGKNYIGTRPPRKLDDNGISSTAPKEEESGK